MDIVVLRRPNSDILPNIMEAEVVRIFPEKDKEYSRQTVTAKGRTKVVAISTKGRLLYAVSVDENKVYVDYVKDVSPLVLSAMIYDAYKVAEDVGDKTTVNKIINFLRAVIARKMGIPVSLVRLENVKAGLKEPVLGREETREVKQFLLKIRKTITEIRSAGFVSEVVSYTNGFIDAINFLSTAEKVADNEYKINGNVIELDEELNVVSVNGEKVLPTPLWKFLKDGNVEKPDDEVVIEI